MHRIEVGWPIDYPVVNFGIVVAALVIIVLGLWDDLLGVRPVWDEGSARVTGITVLPLAVLDRPRVDVTLRISGLFRDIFESQIALLDLAVRRVAALDEDDADNPLA